MSQVSIEPNTGVITATNDVVGGGVSLVQVSKDLADTNALLAALINYTPVTATEGLVLKKLLQNIELDHNGKIIANTSISPGSINNNNISTSAINTEHLASGGVNQYTVKPNTVTQTFLNEVTTPQTVTTTVGSGTTPPTLGR